MTIAGRKSASESGFTLVEMLVALVIFALLAAGGVGVLRASVDTQSAVDTRLAELGSLGRLNALLVSDVAQAVVRPTRASDGERPAFVGSDSGLELVRGGWTNLDGTARADILRVRWTVAQQALVRVADPSLDGARGSGATAAPLARPIAGARFRYRAPDGSWTSSFQSTQQQPFPAAVELTVTPAAGPPVTMVVAFPSPAVAPPGATA